MIIFREKIFRRDIFLDGDIISDDSELVSKYGHSSIRIEVSKKYLNDINKLGIKGSPNRVKLDKLKNDIRKGYLDVDGPAGGKTHYLGDYSKPRNHYTFSKEITDEHRLNYKVYPPTVIVENGVEKYVQRVVLDSCFGHGLTEGDYLNDKELRERKDRMRKNAPYRKPESILSEKNTKNYRGRKNRR